LLALCGVALTERTYTTAAVDAPLPYTLGVHHPTPSVRHPGFKPVSRLAQPVLPPVLDWRDARRDAGAPPPPVRNQGGCGSCWAFATVAPVEFLLWAGNVSADLSEQHLVSCVQAASPTATHAVRNQQSFCCAGGGWWAFDDLIRDGLVPEACYPYAARDRECEPHACAPLPQRPSRWGYVDPDEGVPSIDVLKRAILEHGPVAAAVAVGNDFYAYRRGVYNYHQPGSVNHGVAIIGWNDTLHAWIIRNSWGPGWGMNGYMYIQYGVSSVGDGAAYVVLASASASATASPSPSASPRPSPSPGPRHGCNVSKALVSAAPVSANGTTAGAPTDPVLSRSPRCASAPSAFRAVWYHYDIPRGMRDGRITVSTSGSTFDTQLSLFWSAAAGCEGQNWTCAGHNDDVDGRRTSRITVDLAAAAARRLYIAVHGFGALTGAFTLSLSASN
jgi:hypothetical protein